MALIRYMIISAGIASGTICVMRPAVASLTQSLIVPAAVGAPEVEPPHIGAEVRAVGLEERRVEDVAVPVPDRVGDGERGRAVQPAQHVDRAAIRGVDLVPRQPVQLERALEAAAVAPAVPLQVMPSAIATESGETSTFAPAGSRASVSRRSAKVKGRTTRRRLRRIGAWRPPIRMTSSAPDCSASA
jgi:hypothetical protein